MKKVWKIASYILVAALTSALIRILPLTLIRGKIENRFIQSFLFYLPYVTLAVMCCGVVFVVELAAGFVL